jgi:hypothetical protein
MTLLARLMKTLRLSVVIVASALSLATANAMPDLGREAGRFIQNDAPAPKDVRTFEPAKEKDAGKHETDAGKHLSFALPFRPPAIA